MRIESLAPCALGAGSELLNVDIRKLRLSVSFVSFVLAMALLGPAPAAALCAACALLWFAAAVFGVFMAADAVNFALIATYAVIGVGVPARVLRGSVVTTLALQFATSLLTAGVAVAFAFGHLGIASVGLAAVIF